MPPVPQLVSAEWLAERLDEEDLRVLDATVWLRIDPDGGGASVESGRASWEAEHIPGSAFADLIEDLSDNTSGLPFTRPSARAFAEAASRLGVGEGTRVVVYDADHGAWATRLWWLLRSFGFDDAGVLDGGLTAWKAEGRPLTSQPAPPRPPARFVPAPREELVADREAVRAAMRDGGACLVNALPAPLFSGEVAVAPGRAGRIPGSVGVPAGELVDPQTTRCLSPESLRERFAAAGALRDEPIVAYCGGGIAATADAFALSLIGRDDVAVYDGSLVEWVSDPEAPLETG
ncbi:MAG TPA: sulfurtransferase [Solirubrobacteraceae bacterium]|nr:sulfurtransferase [Solirubrobacteraceae bacterium]